ncbi:hypothetical protein ACPPVU_16155 [Mucilaginibacter sp. McL0603]|uniref:hypothetical protein n=1 Tax=Mucilaginibacter sp. McL0603 TaxID=3415670 RepID=UPI003CEFB775
MNHKEIEQTILNDPEQNLGLTITHQQFVDGIKANKLFYTFVGEPYQILTGGKKLAFNFLVIMYTAGPLVLVTFFAFHFSNWWLLFGILFSYLGSVSGAWKYHIPVYLMLYFIGEAIWGHWHFKDYDDFFFICMFWGYFWFRYADEHQNIFAKHDLLDNAEIYDRAIRNKKLIVLKVKSDDDYLEELKGLQKNI